MKHLYLYFSGTGNTKYVVDEFAKQDPREAVIYSIEHNHVDYESLLNSHSRITFAYPIYESMMPPIMSEFIATYHSCIHHKDISIIITQMIFSGDGASLLWRLIQDQENTLRHTIHINMPNNLTDFWILRPKAMNDTTKKVAKATRKIERLSTRMKQGKTIKMGRKWYSWFLGFFVQRSYAKRHYPSMREKIKINHDSCVLCNQCVGLCPTNNLTIENKTILASDQCTLCYRCINSCPTQAISLLMKHGPKAQYIRDTYH